MKKWFSENYLSLLIIILLSLFTICLVYSCSQLEVINNKLKIIGNDFINYENKTN